MFNYFFYVNRDKIPMCKFVGISASKKTFKVQIFLIELRFDLKSFYVGFPGSTVNPGCQLHT